MESISRETEIGAPLNVSASKTTFRKTEPKADCDGLGQSSARQLRRSRHAGVWAEQRTASVFQRDAGRLGRLRGARPYFGNAFSENGIQGRLRWFRAEQRAAVKAEQTRGVFFRDGFSESKVQSGLRRLGQNRHAGVWGGIARSECLSERRRKAGKAPRARPCFGNAFSENGTQDRLRWVRAEQRAAAWGGIARGGKMRRRPCHTNQNMIRVRVLESEPEKNAQKARCC